MEIILTSNIKKLGKIGDIVKVKDGYARNYLLPNKKAVRKNHENLEKLEKERNELEKKELLIKEKAQKIIEQVKNITLEFTKESDDNGQLYGSIQQKEILKSLKDKSIHIDSDSLIIRKQIKTVGDHEIEVNPYHEISSTIKIKVNSSKKD